MRSSLLHALFLVTFPVLALGGRTPAQDSGTAPPVGGGGWILVEHRVAPANDRDETECRNPIFGYLLGYAGASIASTGSWMSGFGNAFDGSLGCDVLAIAVGTGVESWTYKYVGEGTGDVELTASVQASGSVNLVNPDCAAAALGYTEFSSNISATITAVLTKSVAETGSNQIGSVGGAYKGIQASYNIVVGHGTGVYPDQDQDYLQAYKCTNFFFKKHRARAYVKVWANDIPPGQAQCDAQLSGTVSSQQALGRCPE